MWRIGLSLIFWAAIGGAQTSISGNLASSPDVSPIKDGAESKSIKEVPLPQGLTKEQGDAILNELKAIHQLLLAQQNAAMTRAASPAAPVSEKVQMKIAAGWYFLGREDAPVTIVEFTDYQCPFCRKYHTDTFSELKRNYIDTGKVRFVSRDLPLEFHPFALKAAEAVRCAGEQGKYWEFRDVLFSSADPLNDEMIKKTADNLSLDRAAFQSCVTSEKYKADVQRDVTEAATLQISGTPSFVLARTARDKLDGVRIVGALPFITFQSAIDALLKN